MAAGGAFVFFGIAFLAVGTFATNPEQHEAAQFGYNGSTGPNRWGSLSPNFSTCSLGKLQSPVDIVKNQTVPNSNLKPLTRYYSPANATLVNHGVNIGITFQENIGVLVIDGKNYTFLQMHWHTPSEHRIEGVQFPVELHLVHKSEDGDFSVVAILYQYGNPDPLVTKIKEQLDELAKEECAGDEVAQIPLGLLDTKYLRRNTRKYYRYAGSLTTPPCTEKVTWNILGKVRSISKDQVAALKAPLNPTCKNNYRPCQPLNGRHVELYDELSES